jgi:hypothetical protein
MPASSLIAALGDHIAAIVQNAPPVGAAAPAAGADIPRITVSLEDIVPAIRGLGSAPSAPIEGALRVNTSVDLADPLLHTGGEEVELLSADRRTLQLPHGAVVRASGDDTPPYGTGDLLVRLGATTFTPVHQAPAAGEVQLDIPSGALTFPSPLATSGTLELGYFVGLWELHVERFAATVHLDVAAADADAAVTLSSAVEAALMPERGVQQAGFRRLEPRALLAAAPLPGISGAHRSRRLTYAAEFELIEPVIPSSGGPIRTVDVDSEFDPIVVPPVTESFEVT